jgi:hypothetical protein
MLHVDARAHCWALTLSNCGRRSALLGAHPVAYDRGRLRYGWVLPQMATSMAYIGTPKGLDPDV